MRRHPRFFLRSCAFPFVALVVLALPPGGQADADPAPDQARWKNGELLAPLPSDPAKRAAAIEQAIAFARSRNQRVASTKSVTYPSPATPAPVVYPTHVTRPTPMLRAFPATDPAAARWLNDLTERLRQSEQALAPAGAQAPSPSSDAAPLDIETDEAPLVTTISFDGIDDTGWDPAAPDIAVGPNHVLIATDDRFAVMDKLGHTLYTDLFGNFLSLPASRVYYMPKVVYDSWTPRWVMIYIGTEPDYSNTSLYVAVSHTANPLGQWSYYEVPVSISFPGLRDAPSLALTPNEIYITYNQFNLVTFTFEQAVMIELLKADVYALGPVTLYSHQAMTNPSGGSLAISVQPAQMRTYPGTMYFVNSRVFGGSSFTLWTLTGPPGASVLTGFNIPLPFYGAPPDLVQPNGTKVEAGDCRIQDAVYSSGNLYPTYTRDNAGSPTVELRQIDVVALTSSGTFLSGTDDFAYPAVDINENNQVTWAYCVTGPSTYLSVGYRILTTVPFATVDFGIVGNGLANFSIGAPSRWGYNFGAELDPADNRMVWIHGTYASNAPANSWTTRVAAVMPFPTGVGDGPQRAPMMLDPPAPNPTTGIVRFGYSIDEAGEMDIAVYDARGVRVADVARSRQAGVGRDAVEFDVRKLPSGVYFVKLTTKTKSTSRKFVVTH